jgi:hypothetical protein
MSSFAGKAKDSEAPTLLDAEGGIDLASGFGLARAEPTADAEGSATDAWAADRHRRRTVAPPPLDAALAAAAGMKRVSEPPSSPAQQMPLERPTAAAPSAAEIRRELVDRFALGDFMGSLREAELLLGRDPHDEIAIQYASISRQRLEEQYAARVGSLAYIYAVGVPEEEIRWLGLDPQASSLLSLVDGVSTVQELLLASPMDRLDALRVFTELLDARAVTRVG